MTEDEIKGSLVGYSAETAEELYDLYTKHSTLVGFSVRKGTVRRVPKTGKRRETKAQTPKPNVKNSKKKKPKQQAITRVGCKAMIRVKKNKEGLFEVVQHVMHHNHSLTRLPWQHLPHERQLKHFKKQG
ncbi:Protein FAR1-RELATED SEQUENCE 7 [Bienertia sinuspersici]